MVQLAVGLMFVSAAIIKIATGGFSLDWALSDNLRHQILARFDMQAAARTRAAEWMIGEPWRWHLAALFNLGCQLAPLAAIVFVRRPRVRAIGAGLFLSEVLLLGVVMDLWNPQWLPLAAVFVDWDWLLGPRVIGAVAPVAPPSRRTRIWVAAFALVDVTASLSPSAVCQRLSLYPFTNFPMFSNIRASRPYDEHQPYVTVGQQIELIAEPPVSRAQDDVIAGDNVYRRFFRLRDPRALRDALGVIVADARVRNPGQAIRGARLWLIEITMPPYPTAPRLEVRRVAVVAELAGDDFRTELARGRDAVTARTEVIGGETVALTSVADSDGVTRPFLLAD
jgi:hypothetical protein